MASRTYCVCGERYDTKKFMIQCDSCRDWYHGSCVKIPELVALEMDKYHCPACAPTFGPSKYKQRTNWHRHNPSEANADTKPVQTGTPVFIKELKSRHFASSEDVIVRLAGSQLSLQHLQEHGFDRPILISNSEGLEMMVPSDDFTIRDVARLTDPNRDIDVIDVTRQEDVKMKVQDFVDYYVNPQRIKILNVISLEFTDYRLAEIVEAPSIARKLDWVNNVWPEKQPEDSLVLKPSVSKYCLMGVKDSYTDFHIDFGGSSVWYHILKGEKIFYLIKPTTANLSLYQRWMNSSSRSETFFADQVDVCYKCVMGKGETMLIPTGWIHAVLTPIDSLVFGGNFLHSLNIPMQLQIYDIERKCRTPGRFRFPAFETIHWYAAKALLDEMKVLNNQGRMLPSFLLIGVKALVIALKQWNQDRDNNKGRREQIPSDIEGPKLLKDLSKEVRHAERFLNTLNPPKPERESKRKKKKPVNDDFVDFTEPQNVADSFETPAPLKLTIRTNHKTVKKVTSTASSVSSRPPLKLTLPKPVTYPYSTNVLTEESNNRNTIGDTTILTENNDKFARKPWSSILGDQNLLKPKQGDLKLRLPKNKFSKSKDDSTGTPKGLSALRPKLDCVSTHTVSSESIYDFHEESDDEKVAIHKSSFVGDYEPKEEDDDDSGDRRLMIDEKPKRRLNKIKPFRMKMSLITDGPKNGIEELLKASGYTVGETPNSGMRLDDIESVRASPSTKEAIAGMLSMSMSIGDTNSSEDSLPKSKVKRAQFSDDYGENIDKVHQDDDYIYPSLDASDDDDVVFKPRGRRKLDEAWCPKARVGPLVPKTDRPVREGTKKQCVEKGLEAAAAKRAGLPAPKRPYNRKKIRTSCDVSPPTSVTSTDSSPKKIDPKSRKPRKGMATPKQRLGKILKIHKMKF